MRAAGRTLIVDELLSEVGLGGSTLPIRLTSGRPVLGVEFGMNEVVLDDGRSDVEDELDALRSFVEQVAGGDLRKLAEIKQAAVEVLAELYGPDEAA